MEYYVLWHNFNNDSIEKFNIFNSIRFNDYVKDAIKNYKDYESFKEQIRKSLFYAFHSKVEYELMISGMVTKKEPKKTNIYQQAESNLDLLCKYIIEEHNKKGRKKIKK